MNTDNMYIYIWKMHSYHRFIYMERIWKYMLILLKQIYIFLKYIINYIINLITIIKLRYIYIYIY